MKRKFFSIAGKHIKPGERKIIELPVANLYTQASASIPVHVIHGEKNGPCIFIISTIHGDEVNGIEIVRLLLNHLKSKKINGTLIAIPVANIHGLITLSRYLPDRRDLNRSFPGSNSGSLAARIANLFINEIICKCSHGIDLHTGNAHVDNLPQVRTNLEVAGSLEMGMAFNTPVILQAKLRDGSIRQAATELNIPVLLYEGGQALRFNELAIQVGLRGVLNVLYTLGMLKKAPLKHHKHVKTRIAQQSTWVRSPESGIFHASKLPGDYIKKNTVLGVIADPFAKKKELKIKSNVEGIIIGKSSLPLVNEGDALFNIAQIIKGKGVSEEFSELQSDLIENPFALL